MFGARAGDTVKMQREREVIGKCDFVRLGCAAPMVRISGFTLLHLHLLSLVTSPGPCSRLQEFAEFSTRTNKSKLHRFYRSWVNSPFLLC